MPDPGLPVPNPWRKDAGLVDAVKVAVLEIRKENQWGPRKRTSNMAFRASELGDLVAALDAKGEASGCARKVFFSFWEDKYPRTQLSAEQLLNFALGDEAEDRIEVYLRKAGLFVEGQVRLGAWPKGGEMQGDPRYPDRSGGLVRGACDFVIKHPKHGLMPLEWKSCSTYVFDMVAKQGPKPENALQALFYAHEMGTDYGALGYTNKETGDVLIFYAPAQPDLMARVFTIAAERRRQVLAGELPEAPAGARPAQAADPPGSRRSGMKRMPDEAYYDRAWPCYTYAAKKGLVMACPFYETCHGKLPEKPGKNTARPNPVLAKRKASRGSFEFK
jgi:hypothetical protein